MFDSSDGSDETARMRRLVWSFSARRWDLPTIQTLWTLWNSQMKQFRKQKEEFNGILNACVRTKMPPSNKVMPYAQMHWLKTLIFTHLRFIKAVASDQNNYANNIKMIKVVHQLTLRPNMLISLIDHFTIFNGWMDWWMDSQADPCADLGWLVTGEGVWGGGGGQDQIIELLHFIIYPFKNRGVEGFEWTPWTKTRSATAYTCMLMHRQSGCIIHEHATRMYFKKCIGRVVLWSWAELSYKLGLSWHEPRFMWAKLVLGWVDRNSLKCKIFYNIWVKGLSPSQ